MSLGDLFILSVIINPPTLDPGVLETPPPVEATHAPPKDDNPIFSHSNEVKFLR